MTKRMCFMTELFHANTYVYNPIHVLHVLGHLNRGETYIQKY